MRRRSVLGRSRKPFKRFVALRSRWGDLPPQVLQALEYAEVMGTEALWRQWCGGFGTRRRVIDALARFGKVGTHWHAQRRVA